MVWITLVAAVVIGSAGWAMNYFSSAPQRAQVAFEDGMVRLGPGNYKGAIPKFTESIEIQETAAAYLERGNAHRNLLESEQALADWNQALRMDPNLAGGYTARGAHYRLAGDLTRALADLDKSLQLAPSVDAFYQRGQVKYELGDYQQAISDYTDAINLRREAPYVHLARAAARRALGDEAGAEEDRVTSEGLQVPQTDR